MASKLPEPYEVGLLDDDLVLMMVKEIGPIERLFLAGLGRGLEPGDAARRAGCCEEDADRIAEEYMRSHPIMQPLSEHILRLRELASCDGEERVLAGSSKVQ